MTGAFAVATDNLGASGNIVASADTGVAALPLTLSLCQTDPNSGACISAVGPTVSVTIGANQTPTFSVFVTVQAQIPPSPANKRIFIRFKDAGGVTRGSSSVAVTTN